VIGPGRDDRGNGLHLRVLTFNCFGVPLVPTTGARLATLGRELDGAGHDVICLQEIQFRGYLGLVRRAFASFPHVACHPHLHAPKGGLVTLSRWPVARAEFVPYRARGPWYTPALADWLLHKGVLVTYLDVDGRTIAVLNTHLLANYNGDWSPGNRYARHQQAQLAQLAEVVAALDPTVPAVIMGDFNVPRGSWLYQSFLAATGAVDLLAESDRPTYRQAFLLPDRYAQAIDFIFLRAPSAPPVAATARLVFEDQTPLVNGRLDYLSDHYGVEADLRWCPADEPPARRGSTSPG
jgi:endonuclease/exonuclease/phosphatase family metal-dependent hydrolase